MAFTLVSSLMGTPKARRTYRAAKRFWRKSFFWPLYAARKPRFPALGLCKGIAPATAGIDLRPACGCHSEHNFVPLSWDNIREYARAGNEPAFIRRLQPTAAVIDLDDFANFDTWRIGVSRASSGKYHRSANKARRMGYESRQVGLQSYQRSLHELTGSKLRRSKGLVVLEALTGPAPHLQDTGVPPSPPLCPHHWRQCWASFRKTEDSEKLAAFAILIRAGNLVWVQRFIGHGEALTDGVTKLLIFDIMQWLLARDDPSTQGIRYLLHGYVEEGGIGLFDWKRYLGFKPMLLDVMDYAAFRPSYP